MSSTTLISTKQLCKEEFPVLMLFSLPCKFYSTIFVKSISMFIWKLSTMLNFQSCFSTYTQLVSMGSRGDWSNHGITHLPVMLSTRSACLLPSVIAMVWNKVQMRNLNCGGSVHGFLTGTAVHADDVRSVAPNISSLITQSSEINKFAHDAGLHLNTSKLKLTKRPNSSESWWAHYWNQ